MKAFNDDDKLKQLLKSVKLESPGMDFSARVMNKVFAGQNSLEQVKKLPVLGKGFWIFMLLFAVLFVAIAVVSGGDAAPAQTPSVLSQVDTEGILTGYRAFFAKIGNLPAGVGGILIGASLLVLLEKFLGTRSQAMP